MIDLTCCPCGSKKTYLGCCGQYIEKNELPATPEALMRSRYTAYALNKRDYILSTMRGKALKNFNENNEKNNLECIIWEGLTIISSKMKTARIGYVIFEAHYTFNEIPGCIYEKSEFQKIGSKWFYVNGKHSNRRDH